MQLSKFTRIENGRLTFWARSIVSQSSVEERVPCLIPIEGRRLFIGSIASAVDEQDLLAKGITHVMTVGDGLLVSQPSSATKSSSGDRARELQDDPKAIDSESQHELKSNETQLTQGLKCSEGIKSDAGIEVAKPPSRHDSLVRAALRLRDTQNEILVDDALMEALLFIDEALQSGGSVLVHCEKGISRSTSVVCAYLITRLQMTFEGAIALIRKARPIAQPNINFALQLKRLAAKNMVDNNKT